MYLKSGTGGGGNRDRVQVKSYFDSFTGLDCFLRVSVSFDSKCIHEIPRMEAR